MDECRMLGVYIPVSRCYAYLVLVVLTTLWMPCYCDKKEYIGCYNAANNPMGIRLSSATVTWDKCINSCNGKSMGFNFAAIKDGTHCYCSHEPNFVSAGRADDDCTAKMCDRYQPCGSNTSLAVFWVCKLGYYGNHCTQRCDCNGKRCDRQGNCTELCEPKKAGLNCETEACDVIGKYGRNCNDACHCAGVQTCSKDSGNCWGACQTGWAGRACNQEACNTPGKWGNSSCDNDCHCKDGRACREQDGVCEDGCASDWLGPRCDIPTCWNKNGGCDHRCHTADDNSHSFCTCGKGWMLSDDDKTCVVPDKEQGYHAMPHVVVIVLLLLVVIALIIVIIFCFCRRKARRGI